MSPAATNPAALEYLKRKLLFAAGLVFAVLSIANAQTNAPAPPIASTPDSLPQFEVATIKPVGPDGPHMVGVHVYPGGRLVIETLSLKALIQAAFDLSYWQLSGGSDWMDKNFYDVQAEVPKAPQSDLIAPEYALYTLKNKQIRLMLQALLIDRFQLKFHRDTKTGTVFDLEKSSKPLKLRPAKATTYPSGDISAVSGRGVSAHNTSMPQLAKFLGSYVLHCPVQDQTGLEGSFDFESKSIQTDSDIQNPDPANLNSSFLAMVKEVGLELKSSKGPVETFVIDHADPPSPN
jgi:uncharacterized protein (TIGR03435 family)